MTQESIDGFIDWGINIIPWKQLRERKSIPSKPKYNKEELCCKAEASACAPEEPILLSEEDKGKERKHSKFKSNKEELCFKAVASACAPEESILFTELNEWKLPTFKHNKEELCCKAEASDCETDEPILLAKEDKRKKKKTS